MKSEPDAGVGMSNSVISPVVVIRPIWLSFGSVNHRLPSAPAVMSPTLIGLLTEDAGALVGTGNEVIAPSTVMRPILLAPGMVNHMAPSGPAVMR